MKQVFLVLVILSLVLNVLLGMRKFERFQIAEQVKSLSYYRDIPFKDGVRDFQSKLKKNYSNVFAPDKYYIVYIWDSIFYDFISHEQMRWLDSLSATLNKKKVVCLFLTEMSEHSSTKFQHRNYDNFVNVIQLFEMDCFISAIYNRNDLKIRRAIVHKGKFEHEGVPTFKTKPLYLIIDGRGMVHYSCGTHIDIIKDTMFLDKIKRLQIELFN